jgi:hypothetical protein
MISENLRYHTRILKVRPSIDFPYKDAHGVKVGDLFPHEADIFPQFSSQDLHLIKKALRLLNRAFSKV